MKTLRGSSLSYQTLIFSYSTITKIEGFENKSLYSDLHEAKVEVRRNLCQDVDEGISSVDVLRRVLRMASKMKMCTRLRTKISMVKA